MLGKVVIRIVSRAYSTSSKVNDLISKNVLRQYLFEFRVPLSYKQVISTFEAGYKGFTKDNPESVSGDQLMTLKRVMETYKRRTGVLSKVLSTIETNLVERAAELGNNNAIALLCARVMTDPTETQQNRGDADKLLQELMDQGLALAFKISGDLAYHYGHRDKAQQFYKLAVDKLEQERKGNENVEDTDYSVVLTECLRNIALIYFQDRSIDNARRMFERAVDSATESKQVMDCHYFLGQIVSDTDKHLARYHFEQAARHGLKESFTPLGYLNLAYFNDPLVAKEWFDLGRQVGDFGCTVGLFDAYMKMEDFENATKVYDAAMNGSNDGNKKLFQEKRIKAIEKLIANSQNSKRSQHDDSKDRWNV